MGPVPGVSRAGLPPPREVAPTWPELVAEDSVPGDSASPATAAQSHCSPVATELSILHLTFCSKLCLDF